MLEMFAEPKRRFPDVLGRHREDNRVELQLSVPADLACFPGHFPGVPILPGVVQLYWAEHYGRELLDIALPFSHMETVKFMKLIRPGDRLSLQLEWEANKDLLRFSFSSDAGRHSSGRICFGAGDG
jgi:3-hydroxymyristoyl/3-hydroxydecanoyl-(acyl carrier protein) dehydratase